MSVYNQLFWLKELKKERNESSRTKIWIILFDNLFKIWLNEMKKLDKFSLDSRKRKKKRKKKVTNFNLMVLEINQTKTNIIELVRIKNRRMISCLLSLSYPLFVLSNYYIGGENIANLMIYTKIRCQSCCGAANSL